MKFGKSALLNAFWIPLHFQDTALITIAVPAALVTIAPRNHVVVFAVVAALVSFVSMIVPPVAGALSDRFRARGVPRRFFIVLGAAIDIVALLFMARVHQLDLFAGLLLLATVGANVSLAAYQALIPDIVPKEAWGTVSGVRGVAMVLGTVVGIGVAAGTFPAATFVGIAVCVALGAATLFAIGEHRIASADAEHAHVSDWHDFTIVFAARGFLAFGLALLMTFVLYFFRDVLHVSNPSAGTGLVAAASLVGAIGSGIYLGWLSDRVPRRLVVAACGIPMTLAAAGFALVPEERWMYLFAFLFGIGFGGIMSTGWALAIDSVPKLRDVARDLGIWGIAQNLPSVFAPLFGGWLLGVYGQSLEGYRLLFFAAAASFAAGSLVVLAVGRRPLIPWWGAPLRLAAALCVNAYVRTAYRVRSWGRLPRERGPSLIVSNHQTELDLMGIIASFCLVGGSRTPVLAASAKLLHEPGFMAVRIPWLWRILRNRNFSWLFECFGLLPIENELQTRSIARWAWSVERLHGVLPLSEVFEDEAIAQTPLAGLRTNDLFSARHFRAAQELLVSVTSLRPIYRREQIELTRAGVAADLDRIEQALRRGASFYVTPEGEYSRDGRMLRFRGIWPRLEPIAKRVFLVAISYDPFAKGRFSQLYRIVELQDRSGVVEELQAARPVTVSALLGEWLVERQQPFTTEEAIAAVQRRLGELPGRLFVDPELLRDPATRVRDAFAKLQTLRILLRAQGGHWNLAQKRVHPNFPGVTDIVAFQARFMEQTLRGALGAAASAPPPVTPPLRCG